jgi:translocation and assembly module TamB
VHSDGKLTYQGTLNSQNISGDVNISKARYTERVDWKSWLIQTRKNEVLKIDRDQNDQTGLNVRVIASNLSIDNNVLRAALKMDILLKGTIGQPALLGRVESVNGIIYFRNNELKLLKGVMDFAKPGEIKPFFDILAETRIKNYTVRLALDGYIDQFNLALSSTPTLEEADILSLMAAGDLSKNLKGSSGGIGAGEATSFLTGKLQDVVEDRLKTVIGLDRLQIDPSVSKTTGAVSPRLTISKKLIVQQLMSERGRSSNLNICLIKTYPSWVCGMKSAALEPT